VSSIVKLENKATFPSQPADAINNYFIQITNILGITKLDKEKNQYIREKTAAENIVKEIKQYQEKWLQHIQRMDTNRIPKQALQYKPKG